MGKHDLRAEWARNKEQVEQQLAELRGAIRAHEEEEASSLVHLTERILERRLEAQLAIYRGLLAAADRQGSEGRRRRNRR